MTTHTRERKKSFLRGECPQDGPTRERRCFKTNRPTSSTRIANIIAHVFRDRAAAGLATSTGGAGGAAGMFVSLSIGTSGPNLVLSDSWGLGVSTEFESAAIRASRFKSSSVFAVSAAPEARSIASARTRETPANLFIYYGDPGGAVTRRFRRVRWCASSLPR